MAKSSAVATTTGAAGALLGFLIWTQWSSLGRAPLPRVHAAASLPSAEQLIADARTSLNSAALSPASPSSPNTSNANASSALARTTASLAATLTSAMSAARPPSASPSASPQSQQSAQSPSAAAGRSTSRATEAQPPASAPVAPDQLFAAASPAVAMVSVSDEAMQPRGQGTGFFVSAEGDLVTNYHVVAGAAFATVTTADGVTHGVEGVMALNESADLALLKVKLGAGAPAPRLHLAAGGPPAIGTRVFAIGNPRGLTNTLSDGLVSGHRRSDDDTDPDVVVQNEKGKLTERFTLVQISAPISPGSSGGPLMTSDGLVVGVTSAGMSDGQNLNFAIPAERVHALLAARVAAPQALAGSAARQSIASTDLVVFFDVASALERGDTTRAAAVLQRLRPRYESQPLYWTLDGYLNERLRRYEQAADAFRKVIALDAESPKGHLGLGFMLMSLNRNAEAIDSFRAAAALAPKDPAAYRSAGIAAARMKDLPRALTFFDHALRINPNSAESHRLRGKALGDLKRTADAFAAFDRALALDPGSAETHVTRGQLLLRTRRAREAIDAFNHALALDPDNASAYLWLGDAHAKCGETAQSLACWVNATRFDATGPDGKLARERLTRATTAMTRIE